MTELSALAGSEGYAACDDDGGLYCQKRPSRVFFDSLSGRREIFSPACFVMPFLAWLRKTAFLEVTQFPGLRYTVQYASKYAVANFTASKYHVPSATSGQVLALMVRPYELLRCSRPLIIVTASARVRLEYGWNPPSG